MSSVRLAYGSLHHGGAGALPADLEGVDYLLLDGGPPLPPDAPGPGPLLIQAIERLAPRLYLESQLTTVVSLAGQNPNAIVCGVAEKLCAAGSGDLALSIVQGHDLLGRLEELLQVCDLRNDWSDRPFVSVQSPVESATLRLPASPIRSALLDNSRMVLVGDSTADAMATAIAMAAGLSQSIIKRVFAALSAVVGERHDAPDGDLMEHPRLVAEIAPDGAVSFLGEADACNLAEGQFRRSAADRATAEQPKTDVLPAILHLRRGATATAYVSCRPGDDQQLPQAWSDLPVRSLCRPWHSDSRGQLLMQVFLAHKKHEVVAAAVARLRQRCWSRPCVDSPALLAEPTYAPWWKAWPTWLPASSLETTWKRRAVSAWLDEAE